MKHVAVTGSTLQSETGSRPAASAGARTIHQSLAPFPVAYFTAAFVTDLAYWRTTEVMWERFSVWLIAGGLVMAALVAVAAVIDLASGRQRPAWLGALGYVLAVALSLLNVFIHSRDGYTAVVPTGLMLSAIVVAILALFTFTAGWSLTRDRGVRT
ncbi:MAG TPA: DUF2231 domain-containing protein [Bradyrhizobium sp.]|jgi:uncharacterized membrane protein